MRYITFLILIVTCAIGNAQTKNAFTGSFLLNVDKVDGTNLVSFRYASDADHIMMEMTEAGEGGDHFRYIISPQKQTVHVIQMEGPDKGRYYIESLEYRSGHRNVLANINTQTLVRHDSAHKTLLNHVCTEYTFDDSSYRKHYATWKGWIADDIPSPFRDLEPVAPSGESPLDMITPLWRKVYGMPLDFTYDGLYGMVRYHVSELDLKTPDPKTFSLEGFKILPPPSQAGPPGEMPSEAPRQEAPPVANILGRKIISTPNIQDKVSEKATVVVKITINEKGEVIKAKADPKKSSTSEKKVVDVAENAALKIVFSPLPGQKETYGTIRFEFDGEGAGMSVD